MRTTITRGMIRVLTLVCKGSSTIKDLSRELNLSSTRIYDVIADLEKLNFVVKERKGMTINIKLAETDYAQEFKRMINVKNYVKFEEFLYGLNFRILSYCIAGWKAVKSIAEQLKLSEKTIRNRLPVLMNRGLFSKQEIGLYRVSEKAWPELYSFLEKFRMFSLIKGNVLWKFENEILFQVLKEGDIKGVPTGFSLYPKLRVEMTGIKICCYLPEKKLSEEEIFIHSILETQDAREIMLALVFYLKHRLNKNKLYQLAMKYDCIEKLKDLDRLLNQEETKVLSFIKEKELNEFFEVYDIKWRCKRGL